MIKLIIIAVTIAMFFLSALNLDETRLPVPEQISMPLSTADAA